MECRRFDFLAAGTDPLIAQRCNSFRGLVNAHFFGLQESRRSSMWPWSKKSKTRKTIERRMTRLALESLEQRQVLSAGSLSTAALIKTTGGPAPLVAPPIPSGPQSTLTANEPHER
jgi:hypothetical protein